MILCERGCDRSARAIKGSPRWATKKSQTQGNSMKRILSSLALASFFFASVAARAQTVTIYVDPTTWAYDPASLDDVAQLNVANCQASRYPYTTRYYFAGYFDALVVRSKYSPYSQLQLLACNNIFYLSGTSAYACSTGFNGSGNGVNEEIYVARVSSCGDLYIGGEFGSAGGYSYTSYFSCYRFVEGWNGVNGVFANEPVESLSWVSGYKLEVWTSDYVHGPLSQGGAGSWPDTGDGVAYWHDWYQTFPNGWWTTD